MSRRKRRRQVLLLIETSRAYGRGLVEGVARWVEQNGSWSIFFHERSLTDPFPRWLKTWQGDGVIARTVRKADVDRLRALRVPVVELYADKTAGLPRVFQNEAMAGRLAVDHFLDRGFGKFAFFATDRAHWIEARRQAFERALHERGLACQLFDADSDERRGADDRGITRWLRGLPKPCGVFCASDFYAARLVRMCEAGGIDVPEQVAILGVDNDPVFCETCTPRLSSIDLGSDHIGYEAAALLDRLMSGRRAPDGGVCVAPRQVVPRESTDILAVEDLEVAKAVRFIRQNVCQPLDVGQVAAEAGLSRRVLEQRFGRILRRSPKEEILRSRIERAKSLLSTSDLSIALVAKKSGFASQEYFARLFRHRVGVAPCSYRQQTRPARR